MIQIQQKLIMFIWEFFLKCIKQKMNLKVVFFLLLFAIIILIVWRRQCILNVYTLLCETVVHSENSINRCGAALTPRKSSPHSGTRNFDRAKWNNFSAGIGVPNSRDASRHAHKYILTMSRRCSACIDLGNKGLLSRFKKNISSAPLISFNFEVNIYGLWSNAKVNTIVLLIWN